MDLPLPGQHINQQTMNHLIMDTSTVTDKSMSLAATEVKQRPDTQPSNISGAFKCNVSYDATWYKRGDYSYQGFGTAVKCE